MSSGIGLDGKMVLRRVKRWFDQRAERRKSIAGIRAQLDWRGQLLDVRLGNLSVSGAMVLCTEVPHIGERVSLLLPDRPTAPGDVSWVRDGQVGIHFANPLE